MARSIASSSVLTRKCPQPETPVCISRPPISSSVTFSPITISRHPRRAEVHRGVAVAHDHDVAERRDVGAAGAPTGRTAGRPAARWPDSLTSLWKIRPAPRRPGNICTWSVIRAPGRVDEVDHRQLEAQRPLLDPEDLLDRLRRPTSRPSRSGRSPSGRPAAADRAQAGDDAVGAEPLRVPVGEQRLLGERVRVDQPLDPLADAAACPARRSSRDGAPGRRRAPPRAAALESLAHRGLRPRGQPARRLVLGGDRSASALALGSAAIAGLGSRPSGAARTVAGRSRAPSPPGSRSRSSRRGSTRRTVQRSRCSRRVACRRAESPPPARVERSASCSSSATTSRRLGQVGDLARSASASAASARPRGAARSQRLDRLRRRRSARRVRVRSRPRSRSRRLLGAASRRRRVASAASELPASRRRPPRSSCGGSASAQLVGALLGVGEDRAGPLADPLELAPDTASAAPRRRHRLEPVGELAEKRVDLAAGRIRARSSRELALVRSRSIGVLVHGCYLRSTVREDPGAVRQLEPGLDRDRLLAGVVVEALAGLAAVPARPRPSCAASAAARSGARGTRRTSRRRSRPSVSSPTKSASVSGPIGWLAPAFIAASISSIEPTPSS